MLTLGRGTTNGWVSWDKGYPDAVGVGAGAGGGLVHLLYDMSQEHRAEKDKVSALWLLLD